MNMCKRILIVDDEEQVVFVLRNSLKKLGGMYEIVTASSGQEALAQFKVAPVDLLITDLKMPGMDGVTLTEAVQAIAPQTQVVWMTGYDEWKIEAQRLGVYRYILKPVDVEDIRQVAREGLAAGQRAGFTTAVAGSILILDDNDDLRRLYTRALDKAGFQTFPTATRQEARDLLAQRRFDVFLCTAHTDGERGADLLREQQASLNAAGTLVIMLSAEPCYQNPGEGITLYIEKPAALTPLISLIKRLMANRLQALPGGPVAGSTTT